MKNSDKQITIGTIMSYLSIFISCVGAIFVTPFIVRSLGDSSYGVYRIIVSLISYMSILNFGFGNSAIRYLSEFRVKKQKDREREFLIVIKFLNYIAVLVSVAVGFIVYNFIGNIFSKSLTLDEISLAKQLFQILIVGVVVSIFNDIYAAVINAYERFVFIKTLDVIRNILKIVLVFMVLSFNSSAIYLTIIDLTLNIITLIGNIYYCRCKLKINVRGSVTNLKDIDRPFYKEVFIYAFIVLLNLIVNQLIWNTDSIIIGMRLDSTSASIYGVGTTISSMFYNMSLVIGNMLMPKTVQMVKGGATKAELTEYMIKIARVQAFIIFFIVSAYFSLGRQFITLWMGSQYLDAWTSSLYIMIGTIFASLLVTGHAILKSMNKQNFFMGTYFVIFFLNVFATYWIVGYKGIVGAAFVTMVTFAGGSVFILIPYYQRIIGLNMKKLIVNLCSSVVPITIIISLVLWKVFALFIIDSWLKFFIFAIIYTIIYYGVTYVFATKADEKEKVHSIIKKLVDRRKI